MMQITQPLTNAKDRVVGYVFVNQQVMTQYLLSSRAVQWMLPHVVAVEEVAELNITVAESEESEDDEEETDEDEEVEKEEK